MAGSGRVGRLLAAGVAAVMVAGPAAAQTSFRTGASADPSEASVATDVYVVGGVNAVSDLVVDELADQGYCVERLAGESRVETSVAMPVEMLSFFTSPQTPQRGPLLARDDNPAGSASAGVRMPRRTSCRSS